MQPAVKRIIFYVLLFAVWQGAVYAFEVSPSLLPAPTDVFVSLYEGFSNKTLLYDLLASFQRLFTGLAIALVLGLLLGVLLAKSKTADETLGSLILALQSVPSIVWLPLAIMWFGLNEMAVIFIVVLGATIVMTINVRTGIINVPPLFIKAAKTMNYRGFRLFRKVTIPASIPYAVTGIRLAWAFAWRALMAGELLSTGPGLGYSLRFASDFGDMSRVIAIMLMIMLIGIIVDLLFFQRVEKKVLKKWGLATE
ncbi:ABC transporter permease [Jeotgalibacillus sp. S-D1]|uniref:ABC transporter permease n=1 Tax=Jeotgalibacillus sp. S-D1 TaxID=2552189 RepID=UPI001059C4C4|nr:ABC transporter permease [Jeotgalibacillus sp. S-D1]TDL31118.1 ABC transporter permease [Jeotgalibacillus sp. S-D1]